MFSQSQIEERLLSRAKVLAPHYQIEVTREGRMDSVTINVESSASLDENQKIDTAKLLIHKVKSNIGISARVISRQSWHHPSLRRQRHNALSISAIVKINHDIVDAAVVASTSSGHKGNFCIELYFP